MLDIRRRTGYLLLAVMVGHVILISAQVNSKSGGKVLGVVAFGALAEAQRGVSLVYDAVRHVWGGYVDLRRVRGENETLRRQVAELQFRLQEQRGFAQQSRRLERLLSLRTRIGLPTTAARVIGADSSSWFRTVTIDRGALDGLRADMAVVAPDGVVGRLVEATPRAAKVQLLIDRNAGAGALVERSQAGGVVQGGDDREGDPVLRFVYVSNLADVRPGDVVVTSGLDGIYPKGLVIGRVVSVERGTPHRRIRVTPAVDFAALDEVLVVTAPTGASSEAAAAALTPR